jgi:hypothetical protein
VTDDAGDETRSITEVGRELLKYLHKRLEDLGMNQASYRQARMDLLRILERNREKARFNWGFEAIFTQEIHTLEDLGLVAVKYGSGAIMAGRNSPNSIYNVALTEDGRDTARVILEREVRAKAETAKVADEADDLGPDEDTDVDETDRDDTTDGDNAPPRPAGDRYSHSE